MSYGNHLTSEWRFRSSKRRMRWKRGNRLRLISTSEAPPQTRAIFDELRHSLGVPTVPALYRAYAAFPEFLELHWQAFRPVLASRQFFLLGARLAAESYTRAHNYFEIPSLPSRGPASEAAGGLPIAQVLDYYQYLDPLLLLIASAQMQAFEGAIGQAEAAPDEARHANFPVAPCLLDDAHASVAVQRVWEERRRILHLAFVSEEHRALACWPEFYLECWTALKQLLPSPIYADCQYRIGESACVLARELPERIETEISQLLDAGVDSEAVTSLARIQEAFVEALTGLLLDVTFARIGCEGGSSSGSISTTEGIGNAPKQPAGISASSPTRAA